MFYYSGGGEGAQRIPQQLGGVSAVSPPGSDSCACPLQAGQLGATSRHSSPQVPSCSRKSWGVLRSKMPEKQMLMNSMPID